MTVLLSDGRANLSDTFDQILDTFLKDADFERGFFLKPNIVFPVKASSGEITPPLLTKTLIGTLREHHPGAEIIIGEGVAAGCDPAENFRVSGYAALADELEVPLVDLHDTDRETLAWKFGKLKIPVLALDRTYINLPILKPSSACVISGALKNQKGLLLPEVKKHFHRLGLHEQVAELNHAVRPSLTIMDCSHFFGRNSIIAGDNCGEIDATVCHLLDIEEPEHVVMSRNAQVVSEGFSVIGDPISLKRASDRPVVKEFKRLGRLRLWSNPQACTMCRYLFHDVQNNILRPENLSLAGKLLKQSIKGAEIIMGLKPKWRKEYDTVICIGVCTRRVAQEGGYLYIPGCPPTLDDLDEHLP